MTKTKILGLIASLSIAVVSAQNPTGVEKSDNPWSGKVEAFMGPKIPKPWRLVGVVQNRVDASPAQLYLFNPVTGGTAVWLIRQH